MNVEKTTGQENAHTQSQKDGEKKHSGDLGRQERVRGRHLCNSSSIHL